MLRDQRAKRAAIGISMSMAIATGCTSGPTAEPAASVTTPSVATTVLPSTTESSIVPKTSESVDSAVQQLLDEVDADGFNGVVAIDGPDGTISRAFGTADREQGIAVDTDTVFDIGSITKQFTGAAIVRLEMDGELSVDDPLGDFIGDLSSDKAALTLHQLLTHTAGLPDALGPDDEDVALDAYLDRVSQTPLINEPGTTYAYSNVGYSLLAAVIEEVTGDSYEVYLRNALFEPAGMLETGYVLPTWDGDAIAVGYDSQSDDVYGRPTDIPWAPDGPFWNLRGNGGLLSTAADMLVWDEALRGNDILDAAAKEKLFAPHVSEGPGASTWYGYGWVIAPTSGGSSLLTHNGGNGIFFADYLRFVDDGVTIFVATNAADEMGEALGWRLAELVVGVDLGLAVESRIDEAAARCEFDRLSIDALPDVPAAESFPDDRTGRIGQRFFELVADGDEQQLARFVADHVSIELVGESSDVVVDAMGGLQAEFDGMDVSSILVADERTFHVVMSGTQPDALISIGFDEADPERLACLAIS